MSGANDCAHAVKRFTHHLATGGRTIRMGSYLVNLTPLVRSGLSVRALASDDVQSDKDGAKRWNPGFLEEAWDSYGILVSQFLAANIVSCWNGSSPFSLREGVMNVLFSYYALLLMHKDAQEEAKRLKLKTAQFLPIQTTRALLDLCGHFVLSARYWEASLPWRPRSRQEQCAEHYFGRAKAYNRGNPSVKDAVYGMQALHANELKTIEQGGLDGLEACYETPVTVDELEKMAGQALNEACTMQAP